MSDEIIRLTRLQVREIDRLAVEEFHFPGIVLMENAASGAAEVAMTMMPNHAIVFCGNGNNGGDGFAIARHLHNQNVRVTIVDASHALTGDALTMSRIAHAMKIERVRPNEAKKVLTQGAVLIDALFGTGLTRAPAGDMASLIHLANESDVPILAIDVPSGLDCDTGEPLGPCIRATRTVTFVAEKAGFAHPHARAFAGDIFVVGIGVPRELIDRVRS